jgi:hypothetical protein
MRISKIIYLPVVAALLTLANAVHASVYDFGTLTSLSRDRTVQDSTEHATFSRFSEAEREFQHEDSGAHFGRESLSSSATDHKDGKPTGEHSGKYTSVTSAVPEPETYAMILAGLGLIGFTARRRNTDS